MRSGIGRSAPESKKPSPTGSAFAYAATSWVRKYGALETIYGFSVATKSARSPDGVLITSVISTENVFSRSRLRSYRIP